MRRRDLLRGLVGFGGLAALGACDTDHPRTGVLGAMERWNRGAQSFIFSPSIDSPAGDVTPEDAFPGYKATPGPAFPLAPDGWKLAIGGRVARPR